MEVSEAGKKTEFLNYRPPFFAAISLACGIAVSALLRNIWWSEIVAAVIFIALFIIGIYKKNKLMRLLCGWTAAGIIVFYLYYAYTVTMPIAEYGYVTGRVTELMTVYDNGGRYLLTEVTFNGEELKGYAELTTVQKLSVADVIGFQGRLFLADINPFDSYGASLMGDGIRYIAETDYLSLVAQDTPTVVERIKAALYNTLTANTDTESAGMIMGLMLGERGGISREVSQTLSAAGISHVLSVSGLHVSFMAAMVYGFMRLIRRPPKKALIPLAIILPFYCLLTGFEPGVIRASVTTLVFLISLSTKGRYDALNALSASAIVILAVMPWSLFDLSFQMSYAAVLGIILFYRPIYRAIVPWKSNKKSFVWVKKAGQAVALSISANVLLTGILLSVFGSFAVYFIPANFIAVPIASIIYMLSVPVSLLSLIIPELGILFTPIGYLTRIFIDFSALFAGLPGGTVHAAVPMAAASLFCFGLVFGSGINLLNKKVKFTVAGISTAFFVIMLFTG